MTATITIASVVTESGDGYAHELETLRIVGDFAAYRDLLFNVYVGPAGDTTDWLCLSGTPGRQHAVYASSDTEMQVYLPVISVGGPYIVYVRSTGGEVAGTLINAVTISSPQFGTQVYNLRHLLPKKWAVGARTIESEE